MGIVSGFVVFFMIWWTALFAILPFSVKRSVDGTIDDPKMRQKFFLTTLLSIFLWGVVYILIDMNVVDFRAIAQEMADDR